MMGTEVVIQMSEDDLAVLKDAAESAGVSVSEYVKQKIKVGPTSADQEVEKKQRSDPLNKLGPQIPTLS